MTTNDDDRTLRRVHSSNGLTIDVDIDGTFILAHDCAKNDDESHSFALDHADIVALLDFLATPRGQRIAECARSEHAALMAVTLGTLLDLAKQATIEHELVSIARPPDLVRSLSDSSRA